MLRIVKIWIFQRMIEKSLEDIIDAASDGAPYVLVTLSLAKDMAEINPQINLNVMGFSNMDDDEKINKMISGGGQGYQGGTTNNINFKPETNEYKVPTCL